MDDDFELPPLGQYFFKSWQNRNLFVVLKTMSHSQLFRFARIAMTLAGIWKLELPDALKGFTWLYPIYSIAIHAIYASLPLLLALNFPYLLENDPGEANESLSKILYGVLLIAKVLSYESESSKSLLVRAIREEDALNKYGDDFEKRIYQEHVVFCNRLNKFIFVSAAVAVFLLWEAGITESYNSHRLRQNESQTFAKPLPLSCWYPFDESKVHIWILIEQLLTIAWCALLFVSVHMFSNSMLIYMRGQLKILQYNFSNFFENIVQKDTNDSFPALQFLCEKHQNLIRYINTANCAFKGVLFFEYGISSIVLATSIIQISAGGNITYKLTHLFGVTSQLLLLAWYADEIVFQSLELAPALYESKWYECRKESRVLISMMLMRCQKPLSIDIGSFGAMTVQSAMTFSAQCEYELPPLGQHSFKTSHRKESAILRTMSHSELFRFARIAMTLAGIWKLELADPFKGFTRIYPIYSIMIHVIYVSFPLLLVVNLPYLLKNDPSEANESLSKSLYGILLIAKLLSYQSESSKSLLVQAIREETTLNQYGDDFVKMIYEKHMTRCNRLNKFIFISAAVVVLLLCEVGIAESYKFHRLRKNENQTLAKPLPLSCWYPFDENKYHIWILIEQLLTIFCAGLSFVSVHIFCNSVLIYMRGRLQILQYNFSSFFTHLVQGDANESLTALKLLCENHQNLIAYINTVNRAFKGVVFFEYGISSVILATSILQVTAGGNITYKLTRLLGVTSQLLLLAWSSDEIVVQSLELAPALYQSKWYECSKESRVLINIMLMRCQKPLTIDIGLFGPMTVQSAMTRLKLAYSYTSVMTK
ncbi:uncharacterized protein LOC132706267 isoform X2 [Cylas formicarius]|uniref:uncharacterized protein LOC132706267 isoform X2 n=1 Tax=Cylas formicarius TaxID=197179 RepID=UPI0029588D04|nr:uncharacterized protein LOC132706267 isoform X2 [Cylas formicarius]